MERINEIRNFVISIYDGTEKVWSADSVLKCCKDLLAALEQTEARVKDVQADNIKKAEYIVTISMTCPDEYLASKIVQEAIEKTGLGKLVDKAAKFIGTDASLESIACIDVALDRAERLEATVKELEKLVAYHKECSDDFERRYHENRTDKDKFFFQKEQLQSRLAAAREGLLDIERALGNKGRPHPGYPTPIKDVISITERTLERIGK